MQLAAQELAAGYYDDLLLLALTASFVRNWMRNDVVKLWLQSRYPGNAVTLGRMASRSESARQAKRPMKLSYTPVSAGSRPVRARRSGLTMIRGKGFNTGTRAACRQCGSPDIPEGKVRRLRQQVLSHLRRTQASVCRLCNTRSADGF